MWAAQVCLESERATYAPEERTPPHKAWLCMLFKYLHEVFLKRQLHGVID